MLRLLRFFCFQTDRCKILQQRLQTKSISKKEVNSGGIFDICIDRPVNAQYMWLQNDAIYVSVCGSESEPFSSLVDMCGSESEPPTEKVIFIR